MTTVEAPPPFWHSSLQRLAASLQTGLYDVPSSEAAQKIPTLHVLAVLARAVGDEDVAARTRNALSSFGSSLPVAGDTLLAAASHVAANDDSRSPRERVQALLQMVEVALSRDDRQLALAAYAAAALSLNHVADDAALDELLPRIRRTLDADARRALMEDGKRDAETKGIAAVVRAADVFALTGNDGFLWTAFYVIAAAYERSDEGSRLTWLLRIADGVLDAAPAATKKLLEDEETRGVVVAALSTATQVIKTLASRDADGALRAIFVVLGALRKVGRILENEAVYLEPLLLATMLEVNRQERRPGTIVELFRELLEAYTVSQRAIPDLRAQIGDTIGSVAFAVFSLAFGAVEDTLVRRAFVLAMHAYRIIGDGTRETLCAMTWADRLLHGGRVDEASVVLEQLSASTAPTDLFKLDIFFPLQPPVSIRGFAHDRLAWVRYRYSDGNGAIDHLEQALDACRRGADRIGELRALIGFALVHRAARTAMAKEHAATALRLARALRTEEERAFASLPPGIEGLQAGRGPTLEQMLGGLHPQIIGMLAAMRSADGSEWLAAVGGVVHPEPPFVSELLQRDTGDAESLATLGRCLHELGDPIRAEEAYSMAESADRAVMRGPVARALHQHALLYLEQHRYFTWFAEPPPRTLKWAESGAADSRNITAARQLLAEAYALVESSESSDDVVLRIAIIAAGIDAHEAPAQGDADELLWIDRGRKAFAAHRDWFKVDPVFREDVESRMAVAHLCKGLTRYAARLAAAAGKLEERGDLSGARERWSRAIELYEWVENDRAAGELELRAASVWRYLDRIAKEKEVLEAGIAKMARGTVSYVPRAAQTGVCVPNLQFGAGGNVGITGVSYREPRYTLSAGPIERLVGEIDSGAHLELLGCYLATGDGDAAARIQEALIEANDIETTTGLSVRIGLSVCLLRYAKASDALAMAKDVLARARGRLAELASEPGATITLDLSQNEVSFTSGKESDLTLQPFSLIGPGLDHKAAAMVELYALYLIGEASVGSEAIAPFRECAERARERRALVLAAEAYHRLGVIGQATDGGAALRDLRKARALVRLSKATAGTFQGRFLAVDVSMSLGRYFTDHADPARAIHHDGQAAALYESIRETLGILELQAPLVARMSSVYERLVLATLGDASAKIERAFDWSERAKSRSLLDAVGGRAAGRQAVEATDMDAEAAQIRQEIEETVGQIDVLAGSDRRSPALAALAARRDGLQARYEDLVIEERIESARSRFGAAAQPVAVGELVGTVAGLSAGGSRDVVLLAYFVAESTTNLWLISPEGIEHDRIDISRTALEKEVSSFRARVMAPFARRERSDPLRSVLFGRFADAIEDKRVGIVPHGVLHSMPFAALRHRGRYFVENTPFFVVPSASLLPRLVGGAVGATEPSLLLFADPDGSLRHAPVEAAKVGAMFPDDRKRVLVGAAATRDEFKEHRDEASILHFATHGLYNRRFPSFSSLTLSDGPLFLSDVWALGGRGPGLVVLSSCHTGANQLLSGDELVGLSGAFLRSGATTVIVNLWEAEDATMPIAMERFYDALVERGRSRGEAVHDAVLSLIEEGLGPKSWAGLTLIGNPES